MARHLIAVLIGCLIILSAPLFAREVAARLTVQESGEDLESPAAGLAARLVSERR